MTPLKCNGCSGGAYTYPRALCPYCEIVNLKAKLVEAEAELAGFRSNHELMVSISEKVNNLSEWVTKLTAASLMAQKALQSCYSLPDDCVSEQAYCEIEVDDALKALNHVLKGVG